MREHNWAAIYNTSIHEAYPGHHQQLSAARSTTPVSYALLVDAPEFVEGWAMYCEQMMREQGFDDTRRAPHHVATDAIWRAAGSSSTSGFIGARSMSARRSSS